MSTTVRSPPPRIPAARAPCHIPFRSSRRIRASPLLGFSRGRQAQNQLRINYLPTGTLASWCARRATELIQEAERQVALHSPAALVLRTSPGRRLAQRPGAAPQRARHLHRRRPVEPRPARPRQWVPIVHRPHRLAVGQQPQRDARQPAAVTSCVLVVVVAENRDLDDRRRLAPPGRRASPSLSYSPSPPARPAKGERHGQHRTLVFLHLSHRPPRRPPGQSPSPSSRWAPAAASARRPRRSRRNPLTAAPSAGSARNCAATPPPRLVPGRGADAARPAE